MKNIFNPDTAQNLIARINHLEPESSPLWGKMTVAQMLAHCNVMYEMAFESKHPKPNPVMRFFLKLFVKKAVVSETPYKRNIRTAPQFLMEESKDFAQEKSRLISYIHQTVQAGPAYFHQKESLSFGPLSTQEWNNMFYKHLDHHLAQFGV